MRNENLTKTTKNASLGFTGGVTTEENKRKEKTVVTQTKKGSDDNITQRALECGAYFKALQKKDILEHSMNARVYNALLEGIIIRYAKAYSDKDEFIISLAGLSAVTYSLGRLRQTGVLTDVCIKIQDTTLVSISYELDLSAMNPYKLREIVETHKLAIDVKFPQDYDDEEPTFNW